MYKLAVSGVYTWNSPFCIRRNIAILKLWKALTGGQEGRGVHSQVNRVRIYHNLSQVHQSGTFSFIFIICLYTPMSKIYLFTNIKSHQIQVFVFFKFNLSQIIWPGLTTLHLVETKPNVLHNIKNANKIGHRISIQYLTPPPQALTSVVKWPLLKWLKSSRKTTVCRRLRNCPGSKYFTKKTEIRKKKVPESRNNLNSWRVFYDSGDLGGHFSWFTMPYHFCFCIVMVRLIIDGWPIKWY